MKSIDIKGKAYIPVNERLKEFRSNVKYEGYSLTTDIHLLEADRVIMKATITNADNKIVATGFAEEVISENYKDVNFTSMIENAETSCWGRCLGNLGIGIDTSVASAEEVTNAVARQGNVRTTTRTQPTNTQSQDKPYHDHPEWGRFTLGQKLACPNCNTNQVYVNQNKTSMELFIGKCECGAKAVHLGPPSN